MIRHHPAWVIGRVIASGWQFEWANLRLLERCAASSSEQLDATISGTYGSIRDTLQHIVIAEQLYFSLISTGQRYDRPKDAPPLRLAEMVESVRTTGAGFIEWAPKVQADDTAQDEPKNGKNRTRWNVP